MADDQTAPLESRKDFDDTPREQYKYWMTEMTAASKRLEEWQKQADEIVSRYLDDRKNQNKRSLNNTNPQGFRLNLFNSNVTTLISMLYGQVPRVDVSRADTTGADDVGRVAAEMMERLLRSDVMNNGESYDSIFNATLSDRLLTGLGTARVRYDVEVIQNGEEKQIQSEAAPIDYYYWGDVLWGWGRTFAELPWIAFRSYLTKDEVEEKFGDHAANNIQLKKMVANTDDKSAGDPEEDSPWMKAEVWEIWDKEKRKVCWYSKGYPKILKSQDDPLKLQNFYPCPPFMLANQVTKLYKPTPDYHLSQDLYNEIDVLQTRISILTEAVKVIGVYDKSADGVQRIFQEGVENDLIPVDNWAMFAEKGGLQGQIDWVPLADIVVALDKLIVVRDQTIGLLQQVSGMSDIMRGSLDNQYEGVGQSKIKASFGSTRVQALQEEFAKFASNLMQLKAEVIAKHFDAETIVKQSNMQFSLDKELIQPAVELIKNPEQMSFRVNIKPEQLAQMDYAQLKEERAGYLNGLSTFLQAASPLVQQDPRSTPFLLEMLKWSMAGFKGASDIEGVLDKAIEVMQQPEQQKEDEKPSPEEIRGQIQIKLEEMRAQAKQQELQLSAQMEMQVRADDKQADIETKQMEMQFDMQKAEFEAQVEMQILGAKMDADVRTELLTSQINAEQQEAGVSAEMEKEILKGKIDIAKLKITKRADAGVKIIEKNMEMEKDKRNNAAKNDSGSSDA
ncbi:MAG: hypothetical protein DRQ42_00565 [Gammaproteobacteria bacterium]|nr:MAG: hypothetical protein DRQ42_00565 [Gammaproteobacteria bacterium]